uniref:Coiled-coil domain-containing protein 12 n=1 Tax=Arundo donax TaxID=35708 RepID=A0A0A9DA21_ARUDO
MGAEEDAAARRERLRALRAAKELLSTPDGAPAPDGQHRNGNHEAAEEQVEQPALPGPQDAPDEDAKENVGPTEEVEEAEDDGELPAMKFRNYLPHDEQLRGGKLAPVSLPKFEDPISADTAEPKQVENPFGNIAPKNPNWDLKRDVQKRIDKLEKRTQKALAEIALEQQREKEALEEAQD